MASTATAATCLSSTPQQHSSIKAGFSSSLISLSSPGNGLSPKMSVVHGSLVLVQICFGAGGVIAALGLPACNPFAFALYREIGAGAILMVAAILATASPSSQNNPKRAGGGGGGGLYHSSATDVDDDDDNTEIKESILLLSSPGSLSQMMNSTNNNKTPSLETNQTVRSTLPPLRSARTLGRKNYAWLPWHFPGAAGELGSMLRLVVLGLMIFANQVCVIIGIKLAGPVSCAVWQPSQPILTATISMSLGREPFRPVRLLGVLIAFLGCAAMVVLSQQDKATTNTPSGTASRPTDGVPLVSSVTSGAAATASDDAAWRALLGNCFFFTNCLATSFYVILSKPAMRSYPALFVTAWSYNVAAVIMAATAFVVAQSPQIMNLTCPDCTSYWVVPSGAYFALWYYIVFNSVIAYAILTWANQFVTGTLVMGYTVLQPVTAATLTLILLLLQVFPSCFDLSRSSNINSFSPSQACLEQPGMGTLVGMMGVFVGLFFVVATEPSSQSMTSTAAAVPHKKDEKRSESEGVALSYINVKNKRLLNKRPLTEASQQLDNTEPLRVV